MNSKFPIFALLALTMDVGAAIQCPKQPDVTPVQRNVKSEVELSVGKLAGLKAGELAVKTDIVATNVLEKFPNLDKAVALQMMSATYCQLLAASSMSDSEKLVRWEAFQARVLDLKRTPHPSTSESQGTKTDKPTPSAKVSGPNVFEYPGGKYVLQGESWVQYPPREPGKYFRHREYWRDGDYLYLADETRHKDGAPSVFVLTRLPWKGGQADWSWSNPVSWEAMFDVRPKQEPVGAK